MNHYIHIVNDLKKNIDFLTLTISQATCLKRLEDRLTYQGVVNLFGLHGVGKTFLGWVMEKSGGAAYIVHPSLLEEIKISKNIIVFVDNTEPDRAAFRRLMGTLESKNVEKAIVVTHNPVDDYIFRVELGLNEEDIEIVRSNFGNLGYPTSGSSWINLWHGLIQLARD